LKLSTVDDFDLSVLDFLFYDINSNKYYNNISQVNVSYYTNPDNYVDVCLEYIEVNRNYNTVIKTYCSYGQSGSIIGTQMVLNQSKNYKLNVYVNSSDYNYILYTEYFNSDSGLENLLQEDNLSKFFLVLIIIGIFAIGFHIGNPTLICGLSIFFVWLQHLVFSESTTLLSVSLRMIIMLFILSLSRKQEDGV